MGFWHTGYIEHHEFSGFESPFHPQPIVYQCQHCNFSTTIFEDFRRHRFEAHPYTRPSLFIGNTELGSTTFRITSPLSADEIKVDHCIRAAINGQPVSIENLGATLSTIHNDTISIDLENNKVKATFKIHFEIADENDLVQVEKIFYEVARGRRLDMRAIEHFIHASKPFRTAMGYCDGICEYFFGVLAKEDSPESSLPYDAYRKKFNRAVDQLKNFDRPLANVLIALISFHFNHFNEAQTKAGLSRVGLAASRYFNWLSLTNTTNKTDFDQSYTTLEQLVTDFDSEQIIRWSIMDSKQLLQHKDEIVFFLKGNLPEFDKTKGHILLSELALEIGDAESAVYYARDYRNSPTIGGWAENIIERSKNIG
ncbi:hypothetical protein [Methylomonas sp. YC3]